MKQILKVKSEKKKIQKVPEKVTRVNLHRWFTQCRRSNQIFLDGKEKNSGDTRISKEVKNIKTQVIESTEFNKFS